MLRAIPGAGKSTFVKNELPTATVLSADHYFMVDGEYRFDGSKLPLAHQACLMGFLEALRRNDALVVVDNTNISVAEVAPYAALALAHGYAVEIVNLRCNPEVAAKRCIHGVPAAAVLRMAKALEEETSRLPPWWPQRTVDVSGT